MNRTFLVTALLALSSPYALAQTQVTLYGRLNLSLENQKHGSTTDNVVQNNSSRWGLKASEDLGDGLRAGMQIESGFSPDTGTASATMWGRRSELYLSSANLGTLRLGNFTSEAYFATADYVSMHNHDTGTSSDAFYAYIGNNTNKVAYKAPEVVKNLSLEAAVSLKESGANNTYDLAANYAMGPVQVGAGYEKNADKHQFAVRALVEMGALTLGGYMQRDHNASGPAATTGDRTALRLAAMYALGASEFHVNIGTASKVGSTANSAAQQFTAGYNYNLSKRTKVYTFYTKVNDGAAAVYGGDFSALAVGLRHNF